MSRYKQLENEDSYFHKTGTIDRQRCCDCGLVHDVTYIKKKGGGMVKIKRNDRATAAARRKKK